MTIVVLYFTLFMVITVSAGISLQRDYGGSIAKWASIFAALWVVIGAGVFMWHREWF